MVEVKFCGLTRPADAGAASRLGASYVGVILASGPRLLTTGVAREVLDAARLPRSPMSARRVGVFASARAEDIGRIAEELDLDVVQLHADPATADVDGVRAHFAGEVWAVVRLEGTALPPDAESLASAADAIVLDARAPGALGGTGRTLDWRGLSGAIAPLRSAARLVLAGGLTAENVRAAIVTIQPDVVDVSSGVESAPGIKDHARMRAFSQAAGLPSTEQKA